MGEQEVEMTACVMLGGPDRRIVATNGKTYRFEDHPHCGPVLLTPLRGEIATKQPGERHPFWDAVERWYATGKAVGPDGVCIWTPAPKERWVRVGGRNWFPCKCGDGTVCKWHQLLPDAEVQYG